MAIEIIKNLIKEQKLSLEKEMYEEAYSDRQRRFMCAVKDKPEDRPEGLSADEAEEACEAPLKKKKTKQESAMAGSAVSGFAAPVGVSPPKPKPKKRRSKKNANR